MKRAALSVLAALSLTVTLAACDDKPDPDAATVAPSIETVADAPASPSSAPTAEAPTTDAATTAAPATTSPATVEPTTPAVTTPPAPTSGYGTWQSSSNGTTVTVAIPASVDNPMVAKIEAFRRKVHAKPAVYITVVLDNRKGNRDLGLYGVDIVTKEGATAKYEDALEYIGDLTMPLYDDMTKNEALVTESDKISSKLQAAETTHPGAVNELIFVLPDVAKTPIPSRVFVDSHEAKLIKPAS